MTKLIKTTPKLKPTLYWAYGSNLNVASMKQRCPRARPLKPFILGDLELVFRGVADVRIVKSSDAVTPGGLWRITPACEASLDGYEGVASGFYIKRYFQIELNGKKEVVLFYQMRTKHGIVPPSEGYYNTILRGYRDFNLPVGFLEEALEKSWDRKAWTPELRRRWRDKGQQSMAKNGD
jgi:hypothetical protein